MKITVVDKSQPHFYKFVGGRWVYDGARLNSWAIGEWFKANPNKAMICN